MNHQAHLELISVQKVTTENLSVCPLPGLPLKFDLILANRRVVRFFYHINIGKLIKTQNSSFDGDDLLWPFLISCHVVSHLESPLLPTRKSSYMKKRSFLISCHVVSHLESPLLPTRKSSYMNTRGILPHNHPGSVQWRRGTPFLARGFPNRG